MRGLPPDFILITKDLKQKMLLLRRLLTEITNNRGRVQNEISVESFHLMGKGFIEELGLDVVPLLEVLDFVFKFADADDLCLHVVHHLFNPSMVQAHIPSPLTKLVVSFERNAGSRHLRNGNLLKDINLNVWSGIDLQHILDVFNKLWLQNVIG